MSRGSGGVLGASSVLPHRPGCTPSPRLAATGVEFISVGAITHSAPALDLSMLVEPL
jgi:hypothetical protein